MERLSDFSSSVVEFKPTAKDHELAKLVDSCVGTDFVSVKKDNATETSRKVSVASQTEYFTAVDTNVDEAKLSLWLREIYPSLEAELLKSPTPLPTKAYSRRDGDGVSIQTYQKISMGCSENSQGLATWLAVHTNNAPALALTTVAPHQDWCEHVDQSLRIFIPKRIQAGNFVVFTEETSIALKSCLSTLCTNAFNKNILAGSTLSGDICVWQYTTKSPARNVELSELCTKSSQHGCAVAMDWGDENLLLSCHADGWIQVWLVGKHIQLEKSYYIEPKNSTCNELTTFLSINSLNFVVGMNDGGVYHCSAPISAVPAKTGIVIQALKRHSFMVSTLLKRSIARHDVIISADLSGQVYYHDLRNCDEDTVSLVVQIPLPLKSTITCSRDGSLIYSSGRNGSLDCFRVHNGDSFNIKGAMQGRSGNIIKSSENGLWIITGLHGNEFQIFTVELD